MAKIKQFEAFTNIFVAYKKNWVYIAIFMKPCVLTQKTVFPFKLIFLGSS